MEANGLAEAPLILAGSEALKHKYLGRMTEEPLVCAYGVSGMFMSIDMDLVEFESSEGFVAYSFVFHTLRRGWNGK